MTIENIYTYFTSTNTGGYSRVLQPRTMCKFSFKIYVWLFCIIILCVYFICYYLQDVVKRVIVMIILFYYYVLTDP